MQMKKLFSLLIFFVAFSVNAQIITNVDKLRINEITEMQEAGKILVVDSDNIVQWISEDKITPDLSDYYTKIDVDAILEDYYDKEEVDNLLSNLPTGTPDLADVLAEDNSAGDLKITNLADGVDGGDAVNKAQLDALESPFEVIDVTEQVYIDIAINVKDFENQLHGTTYQEGAIDFGVNRSVNEMGLYSFRLGLDAIASGNFSVAIGDTSEASGEASFALGGSIASGVSSVAMGNTSVASGDFSASFGDGAIAHDYASTAIGRYSTTGQAQGNWVPGSEIFKVGNGIDINRKNAYVLYNDGKSKQEGIAEYMSDLSSQYTDRSLVDKAYVDNAVADIEFLMPDDLVVMGSARYNTIPVFYDDESFASVDYVNVKTATNSGNFVVNTIGQTTTLTFVINSNFVTFNLLIKKLDASLHEIKYKSNFTGNHYANYNSLRTAGHEQVVISEDMTVGETKILDSVYYNNGSELTQMTFMHTDGKMYILSLVIRNGGTDGYWSIKPW